MRVALAALLLLSACSGDRRAASDTHRPTSLEAAAIEAGVIADPADTDPTGLYASDGDRLCVIPAGQGYRAGLVTGDAADGCRAAGTARRDGDRLILELGSDCEIAAGYEGDRIILPGTVSDRCDRLCSGHASLAGISLDQLSNSASEAAALRDRRGRRPCG